MRLWRRTTRGLGIPFIVLLLLSLVPALPVAAGTPSSGTLSDSNRTLTYTAGPFLVANTSGTVADPICTGSGAVCDDFQLTVNVPAGYETSHNVRVVIQWPNPNADFDLYILDATGTVLTSSASSSDPEIAQMPARAGRYIIRVVPWNPLGQSFTGTLSIVDRPPATPANRSPEAAPGLQNYVAPNSLPNYNNAGEPSIGVNWNTGNVFYQSYTSTYRVAFDAAGNATWLNKSAGPPKCTAADSLDPILFTDSVTGRTLESQLFVNPVVNSLTCFTTDEGETWTPSQGGGPGQGIDHQTIGGGPYSANGLGAITPAPSYIGPDGKPRAIYYCSQQLLYANCSRSDDGGLSFKPAVTMYSSECGGLHGHVKVAPDGTVYVPNKGCTVGGTDHQAVVVSEDNGQTWQVRVIPTSTKGESDPSVGIGSDGTVYFGYQNSDGHAHIAVSRDKGKTWSDDQDVGAMFGVENIVFPAVVAGDGDRAAFAFHGTTTPGFYQNKNFNGTWHLYVAYTYDRGKSWVTTDATPTDPVQKGCIWLGGGSNPCRNLLDFMDATVDKQGRVLVGYADGCIGSCITRTFEDLQAESGNTRNKNGNGFRVEIATIARQTTGKPLFAAFDATLPPGNGTPPPPAPPGGNPPPGGDCQAGYTDWTSRGGILTDAPAATGFQGRLYVFAKGTDNALYVKSSPDGTTFSAWQNLGGILTDAPAAASFNGQLYVFARGTVKNVNGIMAYPLYEKHSADGVNFTDWRELGGNLTARPAATSVNGTLYLYAKGIEPSTIGTPNPIYPLYVKTSTDGVNFGEWQNLAGNLTAEPAATGFLGQVWVFARGTDNALYEKHSADGVNYTEWRSYGGVLVAAPAATSYVPNCGVETLYVFASGTGNALYERHTTDGNNYTQWQSLGGQIVGAPAAAGLGSRVYFVARGTDNTLWERHTLP